MTADDKNFEELKMVAALLSDLKPLPPEEIVKCLEPYTKPVEATVDDFREYRQDYDDAGMFWFAKLLSVTFARIANRLRLKAAKQLVESGICTDPIKFTQPQPAIENGEVVITK